MSFRLLLTGSLKSLGKAIVHGTILLLLTINLYFFSLSLISYIQIEENLMGKIVYC